jgi:hypothetical protein
MVLAKSRRIGLKIEIRSLVGSPGVESLVRASAQAWTKYIFLLTQSRTGAGIAILVGFNRETSFPREFPIAAKGWSQRIYLQIISNTIRSRGHFAVMGNIQKDEGCGDASSHVIRKLIAGAQSTNRCHVTGISNQPQKRYRLCCY